MADSYRMARFRASLVPRPPLKVVKHTYTDEQRDTMLLKTVTMDEIRQVASLLGLTFKEAYAQRDELYRRRYGIR